MGQLKQEELVHMVFEPFIEVCAQRETVHIKGTDYSKEVLRIYTWRLSKWVLFKTLIWDDKSTPQTAWDIGTMLKLMYMNGEFFYDRKPKVQVFVEKYRGVVHA